MQRMELHVRAVSARNLLDKQTFGKQDPYCKISVGSKTFRTRVHDNGHKTPVWDEKFVFEVYDPQLEQVFVQVKDKNFTASVLIGEVRLPVNMFLHGSVTDQWYTLNNGSRRAGEINLRVQLLGGNLRPSGGKGNKVPQAQAYPAAAPAAYGGYAAPPQQYQQPSYPQQPAYPAPQAAPYPPPQQLYPAPAYPAAPAYAPPPAYAPAPAYPAPAYPPPPPAVMMAPAGPPTVIYGAPVPIYGHGHGYHHHHHRRRGSFGGAGEVAVGAGAGLLGAALLHTMDGVENDPSTGVNDGASPLYSPQRRHYLRSQLEGDSPGKTRSIPPLELKLNFQYKGDLFSQHGAYTDATLYMSRLPSAKKHSTLRPKTPSKAQVRLAPMLGSPGARPDAGTKSGTTISSTNSSMSGTPPTLVADDAARRSAGLNKQHALQLKALRKRQYALAVEAMAANALLHGSLLADNAVPSILSLSRTKDPVTLASCLATLCHLTGASPGREAVLSHNALPLLTALATSPVLQHEQRMLLNYLATLANLTIEDSFESVLVKEKALECVLKHRKTSERSAAVCTFAIFNLSCPAYSYPRIDDVIRALRDHALDASDRVTLSRALYNVSCTRLNQLKLVENDAISIIRVLLSPPRAPRAEGHDDDVRRNALMALWHLAENPHARRAIKRLDCMRLLVTQISSRPSESLPVSQEEFLGWSLVTMISLSADLAARELLGRAGALDALARLAGDIESERQSADSSVSPVIYRLIALILSAPRNVPRVTEEFFAFLLGFRHALERSEPRASSSRYVLFALASILAWTESDDLEAKRAETVKPPTPSASQFMPSRRQRRPRWMSDGEDDRGDGDPDLELTGCGEDDPGDGVDSGSARHALEDLLDEPTYLEPLLAQVEADCFPMDSPEVFLQMVLLYNLSFRYNKVDVATRSAARLLLVATTTQSLPILTLVCCTLFSLCQAYEVHAVLQRADVLPVLQQLAAQCDEDTQAMCLEIVCMLFDGRHLSRPELLAFIERMAPTLAELCTSASAVLRAGCAACLARFASLDECRHVLVAHGIISALARLAGDDDPQTLRLCVHAYSFLSRDAAICAQLIHSGIIKALTFLAAAPEEPVRRACAMTLCNLSTAEQNIGALAKAGALRALLVIACVKSNDPETRRICMKAVMNLLRLPANIPQMCQDGLLWAFGLFTSGMEPKDYDVLCDAFGALAFYPTTRKGMTKPVILSAMLPILTSPLAASGTKVKLLKGLSNLLCDLPHAAQLHHVGVLPVLVALVGSSEPQDPHIAPLAAQLLVLIFQSCPDAEADFTEPAMVATIVRLLDASDRHVDTARCGAMLLYLLATHERTRPLLLDERALLAALPELLEQVPRETQALLVRTLFHLSTDRQLLARLPADHVVACVAPVASAAMQKRAAPVQLPVAAATSTDDAALIATLTAGLLRNLSVEASAHAALTTDVATGLLVRLFEIVEYDVCKEDAAVCLCNLLLGRVNSSALLSRPGVLAIVLWLCSHAGGETQALGSAVVRKLALAPGNAPLLIDGGAVSHLALLLHDTSVAAFVKTNCIATFCCLARRPGVPALLASYGVIASVLQILQSDSNGDAIFEAMCTDLLSALAEFARSDDPHECHLSSVLFQLLEKDDNAVAASLSTAPWHCDRTFLERRSGSASGLPPAVLSVALQRVATKPPALRHTLYPIRVAGHAVEFSQMPSPMDMRTIEPIIPQLSALGETPTAAAKLSTPDSVPATRLSPGEFSSQAPPSRLEFMPKPMYPKLREAYAAIPSPSMASPSPIGSPPKASNNSLSSTAKAGPK
ncbi:hypothetical protein P43SY_007560 [Pythium insidiosum]|uniref:C2 domain-containing protein n=1 Tax=Pythium insidiosum TaxID=114742 RepID=A0AAD5LMK2_PYTIN|nr:hypothetical protein P43SY_007560 [Pythium insidiosum]